MRYGGVTLGAGLTIILGGAIVSFDGIGHDRWLEGFNGFLFGGAIGLIGLVLLTIGGIHRAKRKQNLRDQQKAQVRRKLSFTGDGFRLRF